jgi:hypothetical protein
MVGGQSDDDARRDGEQGNDGGGVQCNRSGWCSRLPSR